MKPLFFSHPTQNMSEDDCVLVTRKRKSVAVPLPDEDIAPVRRRKVQPLVPEDLPPVRRRKVHFDPEPAPSPPPSLAPPPVALPGPTELLRNQASRPNPSPVSAYMAEEPTPGRTDTTPSASPNIYNAIESAARLLGSQVRGVILGEGGHVEHYPTSSVLTDATVITGPNEDEAILFEYGTRPSQESPGTQVYYPMCALGVNCVSHTHSWPGLKPGEKGPILQVAMTPSELYRVETGKLYSGDTFSGRLCLLDLWLLLSKISIMMNISSVLCNGPSMVIPRCPRVGDRARSVETDDVYAPNTLVVPSVSGTSPFAQPFPKLRISEVYFFRDPKLGVMRCSLNAYRLFPKRTFF